MKQEGPSFYKFEDQKVSDAGKEGAVSDPTRLEAARQRRLEIFKVNNKKVELHGIAHISETLSFYRRELEGAIDRASVVVLEAAPVAEKIFSNEMIELLQEYARKKGSKVSREEIVERLESNDGLRFFRELENIAAQKGKRIVTLDPSKVFSSGDIQEVDSVIQFLKVFIALGGTIGLVMEKTSAEKYGKNVEDQETIEKKRPSQITRRTLLKGFLGGAAALAYGSIGAQLLELLGMGNPGLMPKRGRKDNPAGLILYDQLDYRDVSVARGLGVLTRRRDLGEGPVVAIYGGGHASTIKHYAESPRERDAKFEAYRPYRLIAPPRLRIYEFLEKEGWRLAGEEDI